MLDQTSKNDSLDRMLKPRVTQQDVAIAAGVHKATVSLVFRNHPSIPRETKKKIRAIAKKVGYAPDPMLSALAVYRNSNRVRAYQGTLAWLGNSIKGCRDWRHYAQFVDYYEGARKRAGEFGFNLEIFDLQAKGQSVQRLVSILHSRNIRGILLTPQPKAHMEVQFPWDQFSAVTFGFTLKNPQLHTVTSTHYRATLTAMRKMLERGYRRIAFACSTEQIERTDGNYLAAYLLEQRRIGEEPLIPNWDEIEKNPRKLCSWVDEAKPDSFMSGNIHVVDILKSSGYRVPKDFGVTCLVNPSAQTSLTGIYENAYHTGEVAVDFLVGMIQRGEVGVAREAQLIHIDSIWIEGRTLPSKNIK